MWTGFEAKRNRSDQVANFNLVDKLIKAQVGAECDPFVLESLEKETLSLPTEPKPVYKKKEDSSESSDMSDIKKMKFKSKFDKYLNRLDKVENQLKQIFSEYYGQIDDDMKASLKEDDDSERSFNEKDVIKLRKMLKHVNFDYKKSEEPIKTLWQANKDLINLRQHKLDLPE